MLQTFGDTVKGSKILGYLIIGIISIPFALFGIQSYLGGGDDAYAAKVNDHEISIRELDQEAQLMRQRLAKNFGGKIPDAFNQPTLFKTQALDNLVKKAVLRDYLQQYHFAVSDKDLANKILSDKTFLKDGKFDQAFYEAQVQSLGYSIPQFEEVVRDFILLSQVQEGITNSAFVLKSEQQRIESLKKQKRKLVYYLLEQKQYRNEVNVSEQEIKDYYAKHQNQYKNPEKLKLAYIELNMDDIAKTMDVTDEEINELYEQNKELYKSKEKRKASHILVKVKPSASQEEKDAAKGKLLELKKQIEKGASFAELAKKESQDIGSKASGGELGWVERGIMVKPFEDALFSMEKGAISDPVLSSFGYHLIYLQDIKQPEIKPLPEVKQKLKAEIQMKKADSAFYDLSEVLATQSYENSDNLDAAAEATGLKIKTTEWLDRLSNSGIFANEKVKNAAFSQEVLKDRINSELLDLGDNHVMVIRLSEYQDATVRPLADVHDAIKTEIKSEKLNQLLLKKADKLVSELKASGEIQSIHDAKKIDKGMIGRDQADIDPAIREALFKMHIEPPKKSVSKPVSLKNGVAVISSDAIETPEIDATLISNADLQQAAQQEAMLEYSHWLNALKAKSEIEINKDSLQ